MHKDIKEWRGGHEKKQIISLLNEITDGDVPKSPGWDINSPTQSIPYTSARLYYNPNKADGANLLRKVRDAGVFADIGSKGDFDFIYVMEQHFNIALSNNKSFNAVKAVWQVDDKLGWLNDSPIMSDNDGSAPWIS